MIQVLCWFNSCNWVELSCVAFLSHLFSPTSDRIVEFINQLVGLLLRSKADCDRWWSWCWLCVAQFIYFFSFLRISAYAMVEWIVRERFPVKGIVSDFQWNETWKLPLNVNRLIKTNIPMTHCRGCVASTPRKKTKARNLQRARESNWRIWVACSYVSNNYSIQLRKKKHKSRKHLTSTEKRSNNQTILINLQPINVSIAISRLCNFNCDS